MANKTNKINRLILGCFLLWTPLASATHDKVEHLVRTCLGTGAYCRVNQQLWLAVMDKPPIYTPYWEQKAWQSQPNRFVYFEVIPNKTGGGGHLPKAIIRQVKEFVKRINQIMNTEEFFYFFGPGFFIFNFKSDQYS